MSTSPATHGPVRDRTRGQIIVLFALAMVAMLVMASLLFDGANALLSKRQLQDAADAAALAAANVIAAGAHSCLATGSASTVRSDVQAAAVNSVAANLPGFDASTVSVSCPGGWSNQAVAVGLHETTSSIFGGIIGQTGMSVSVSATAVNGGITSTKFSVVELDPSNLLWPKAYSGCPAVLFSGTNTVLFDGSMQVDSACAAANGGALSSNGNSATVTFASGASINLVGGYAPGPLKITPTPLTGQPYVKDPLAGLPAIPVSSLPVRSTKQTTLNGGSTILEPGVYVGGIAMKNSAIAYLHPGIYVFTDDASGNGGFSIGAQNQVFSIPRSLGSTSSATWATSDCPVGSTTCGVLLFNTGMTGNDIKGSEKDQITVGAGATVMLRPYQSTADGTGTNNPAYQNLLIWQDRSSVPSATYAQPPISLKGGGQVSISGTVYTPSAAVQMGGNSGGSGGNEVDITLQFISWDLQFNGNIGFHFYYQSDAFAKPLDYGLVQ
jgi:hypothetical protein